MSARDRVVVPTLDVAPTVSGKRDVCWVVVTEERWCVNNESASHSHFKTIEGDFATRERGESPFFFSGEVSLLKTDDVTLGDKIGKGLENAVFPTSARRIGGVVGETVHVVRKKTRDQSGGGSERGEAGGTF